MTAPRRVDGNSGELDAALKAVGIWYADTHELGHGFPDRVTFNPRDGLFRLVEYKSERGTFTGPERRFIDACPGEVHVVRTVDDALRAHGMEGER